MGDGFSRSHDRAGAMPLHFLSMRRCGWPCPLSGLPVEVACEGGSPHPLGLRHGLPPPGWLPRQDASVFPIGPTADHEASLTGGAPICFSD